MADIKGIIFMATALCLTVGFVACGAVNDDKPAVTTESSSVVTATTSATTTTAMTTTTKIYTTAEPTPIPELTIQSIRFNNGCFIFVDKKGNFTLCDADHKPATSLQVTGDEGETIIITVLDGKLEIKSGGKKLTSFKYGGHTIEFKKNVLYYDKSKLVYEDTALSSYKIDDEYSIVCYAKGHYRIHDNEGKVISKLSFVDDNNNTLILECEQTGLSATNSRDEYEPCFKLNGDFFSLTDSTVYINGIALAPSGSNDIKLSTTTVKKVTTTTTKAPESEPEKTTTTTTAATTTTTTKATTTTTRKVVDVPEPTTTATTGADKSNQNVSDETLEMLGYVNAVRQQYGLNELYGLESLDGVSQVRADELLKSYSHTRPDGKAFDTAIDEAGLEWWHVGENICNGIGCMSTVKEAFDAWMASEEHRANILNPQVRYMALAKSTTETDGQLQTFWEQIFYNDVY